MLTIPKQMYKSLLSISKILLLGLGFSINLVSPTRAAATGGSFNKKMPEQKIEQESANSFYAAFLKNQVEVEREEERLKRELRHQDDYNANHPKQPKIFEIESMKLLMRYFDSNTNNNDSHKIDTYLSANVYNDLNVFPDPQNPHNVTVFSDFSNLTHTMAGKLGLLEMLNNPLSDIEKLRERQRILEYLSQNNDLFNQLDTSLAQFGKAEKSLLYFMKTKDDGNNGDDFRRYFDNKINSGLGSIGNNTAWYFNLGLRATPSIILGMFSIYIFCQQTKFLVGCGNMDDYIIKFLQEFDGWEHDHCHINTDEVQYARIAALFIMITSLYGMQKCWTTFVAPRIDMGKRIQSCMIDVGAIIEATQEIGELVSKNDIISNAITGHKEVLSLISGENCNELKSIIDMFDSSTFKGEASSFGRKGRIFKAFKTMCEKADKFTEIMRFVSRLDAIMSIVKALRKSASNNAKYSIPKFLKSEEGKPYLCAKKFWHPTLDAINVVTNDIELGKTNRNIILTGANAGGKTTWTQALALVAVLSQTFGIVPAEAVSLTPFSLIIVDTKAESIIGKQSMFENEVHKLTDATQKIKSLGKDKFALYMADEPLKGSNAELCANEAYNAIGSLGLNHNALIIVATHFEKLTELGDPNKSPNAIKGVFANYKVDSRLYECAKYPDKFLHHTYKVIPGVITETVTDFLLEEARKKNNLINFSTTDKPTALEFVF